MKNNITKFVSTIAISIVFVISTTASMFSGGGFVNTIIRDIVLNVDNCYYTPIQEKDTGFNCSKDTNQTKRDVAQSVSLLMFSVPLAIFTYGKIKKK